MEVYFAKMREEALHCCTSCGDNWDICESTYARRIYNQGVIDTQQPTPTQPTEEG